MVHPNEELLNRARLVILELREKLAVAEAARPEPIAVIGMACKFPGEAENCDGFWRMIVTGSDAVSEIPASRWDRKALYHPDPGSLGKIPTLYGSFLKNVDLFDAAFFDISPREAVCMDPQQRLFLEVAWHALEDAGQVRQELAGSETGVFVGVHSHSNDYSLLQSGVLANIETYTGPGTAHDVIAGRLSYVLDLHGPSVAINTACSSSLAALHIARRSLLARDCRMAIVGGVNLILGPASTVMIARLSMLAPDGRCKAFDAEADGFGRGEGCGVVILKRLSDAIADHDHIVALIRGSAMTQDGRTNGLTAPNGLSQQTVIRQALKDAGVEASEVTYVEAHGTGTALGDPIEVDALAQVFGKKREDGLACALGSVKANIGHLEGAAGVAGLIKAALCLKHRTISPVARLKVPNPHIAIRETCLLLPTSAIHWDTTGKKRYAGVSSFGWSGTNVHVVLEEWLNDLAVDRPSGGGAVIVPLSAATSDSLSMLVSAYTEHLEQAQTVDLRDVSYTASRRRTHHAFRIAVAGTDASTIIHALKQKVEQPPAKVSTDAELRMVFAYGGELTQKWAICRELLDREPVFHRAVENCAAIVWQIAGWDLVAQLTEGAGSRLSTAEYGQPSMFALQVALTELFRSWGTRPEAVVGYGLGEVTAAWAAGALRLEDGVKLVVQRGRCVQQMAGRGATGEVGASLAQVQDWIRNFNAELSIAAVNGNHSTVITGDRHALENVFEHARSRGLRTQMLSEVYAFGSPLLRNAAQELASVIRDLPNGKIQIPLYSTVTGAIAGTADLQSDHWRRNLYRPVLFGSAVEAMLSAGYDAFLEIGVGDALTGIIKEQAKAQKKSVRAIPVLRGERPDSPSLLTTLADLYEAGANIDWSHIHGPDAKCISLPVYPFSRKRYWIEKGNPGDGDVSIEAAPEDWFYEVAWREKNLAVTSRNRPPIPASEIAVDAERRLLACTDSTEIAGSPDTVRELEDDAVRHMVTGLRNLGFEFRSGERFNLTLLAERLGIQPRHAPLFRRILSTLVRRGILKSVPDGFQVCGEVPHLLPSRATPVQCVEGSLLKKCGPRLAEVLRGNLNALELLFAGNGVTAESVYRQSATMKTYNALVRHAFDVIAASIGRELRVLEIGAGTGATTSEILANQTASIAKYVFTDVSRLLLADAAGMFRDRSFLRFELLDIEREPGEQGFTEAKYDIVIAANVLHATSDLPRSLSNVCKLLAPGGVLLLLETTASRSWIDLTFGLTDGWWKFNERDGRSTAPLLSSAKWIDVLRQNGFDEVATSGADLSASRPLEEAVLIACKPARVSAGRNWLVLADSDGLADGFAAAVRRIGGRAVLVRKGAAFRRVGDQEFTVDPENAEDLNRLFSASAADWLECSGVVYMWGLDRRADDDVAASAERVASSALLAFQSVARDQNSFAPMFWLVSKGAQRIPGNRSAVDLAQATIWGIGRATALEHPNRSRLVDLDPSATIEENARRLLEEVSNSDGEDEIAVRNSARYVARLLRSSPPERDDIRLRSDATYVLTGAFGRLGSKLTNWMAARGASHLVLIGRSGSKANPGVPSSERPGVLANVRDLEAKGVQVRIETCDVADRDRMSVLFEILKREWPPVRGIIHAAAEVELRPLLELQPRDIKAAFHAKVHGSWVLHEITQELVLDFMTFFSSAASSVWSKDLASYAAANCFMDALAAHRRSHGLPAISIGWGAWETRQTTADKREAMMQTGFEAMPAGMALNAMGRLLLGKRSEQVVARVDWATLKPTLEKCGKHVAAEIAVSPVRGTRAAEAEPLPGLQQRFRKMNRAEQREVLVDCVAQEVRRVFGLPEAEPLDCARGLFDLGMDSLMAVELRHRLERLSGCSLPATLTLNCPNVNALAEYLDANVLPDKYVAGASTESTRTYSQHSEQEENDLANLSDAAAHEALLAELEASREAIGS